jgi:hypothetical protein
MTSPALASELLQHTGPAAVTLTRRLMPFLEVLGSVRIPAEWRAYANRGGGARALFDIVDNLRSASLRAADIETYRGENSAAAVLSILMKAYEQLLQEKNVPDCHDLIEKAARALDEGSLEPSRRCFFDCLHDAAPNEFRLAAAIAQAGGECVLLCDPYAPPPPDRATVRKTDRELLALLPNLKCETAPQAPGSEMGRSIAEGRLEKVPILLEFNDLPSECRGLAEYAKNLAASEGIPENEIAFYLHEQAAQAGLLSYELHRTGLLTDEMPTTSIRKPFQREMRLVLGVLAEPDRADLRAQAISRGLAEDEAQLDKLLAGILAQRDSVTLTEFVIMAVESLLHATDRAEKKALSEYERLAQDFEALASTGAVRPELHALASAIDGLTAAEWTCNAMPSAFLTPAASPVRFYDTVFLPCLVSGTRASMPPPPGMRELIPVLERSLPDPVCLQDPAGAQLRERWESGNAAASAGRTIMSLYRQQSGRRVEPAAWLRDRTGFARPGPSAVCTQPGREAVRSDIAAAEVAVPFVLSVTSIRQYSNCPYQFFLDRILQIKPPPGERVKLGSLIHRTLAGFHSPGEKNLSPERVMNLLEEEVRKEPLLPEPLAEARALLEAYASAPGLGGEETLRTEYPFEIGFAGARVSGRIDRIVAAPGGVKVIDYKMSGSGKVKKHKNAVVDRLDDVQMPLYVMAAREAGMTVAAFSYVYLNYEGSGLPAEILLRLDEDGSPDSIAGAELQQSLQRIEGVITRILAGKAAYDKGDTAPCNNSPARCAYAAMCPLMAR